MKNIKFIYLKITLLLGFIITLTVSCEREYSDDVAFASHSANGEIFIDGFVGGLDYFPFGNSFAEAFSVESNETYKGEASMRFDIPVFGVGYGGATFPSTAPRDLSGYDALTFWAKASQGADINEIGFGINGDTDNKYRVTMQNLAISTQWTKYIIPIPDASKLDQAIGMFWYAEGAENINDEGGYTFWIDELKFEKLGTLAQPQPAIFFGEDLVAETFLDTEGLIPRSGLTQTFNLASGINETVIAAPSYFTFSSSDVDVVRVSELGVISPVGIGTAKITATLGGVKAKGSLTLEVGDSFEFAPIPTRDASNVISIFSDAYTNVAVDYYNGFFTPDGQTTLGGEPPLNLGGGQVINYTLLNFVGIGMFDEVSPINATQMTHLHVDINVQEAIDSGDFINIQLLNSVGNNETSGTVKINSSKLLTDEWVSLDIPLSDFAGLGSRNEIGLLFFISDSTISNIFVDNIYFYKE
jgi:hypothetical protein